MTNTTPYSEELVKKFKEDYALTGEDFWQLKVGKKQLWIIKHNALERVATAEGIDWKLECLSFAPDVVVKCTAYKAERYVESFGEANPNNSSNKFPYAMAEKRAVDRCILKLLDAHAYIYSDEEADDFKKEHKANEANVEASELINSAPKVS
jgi:hypothetical protein